VSTILAKRAHLAERQQRQLLALERGDLENLRNEIIQIDKSLLELLMIGDINAIFMHKEKLHQTIVNLGERNPSMQVEALSDYSLTLACAADLVRVKHSDEINEAVLQNLINFQPWDYANDADEKHISTIVQTWLRTGRSHLALPLLDVLIRNFPSPEETQTLIFLLLREASLDRVTNKKSPWKTFLHWAWNNQPIILNLGSETLDNLRSCPLDLALDLHAEGLNQLAAAIAEHTTHLPYEGDLFRLRSEMGIKWSDEKLLAHWANEFETSVITPGKFKALYLYTLAYHDAPLPPVIALKDTGKIQRSLLDALRILDAAKLPYDPARIGHFLDDWWAKDPKNAYRDIKALKLSDDIKMSCAEYRTHKLQVDLGL